MGLLDRLKKNPPSESASNTNTNTNADSNNNNISGTATPTSTAPVPPGTTLLAVPSSSLTPSNSRSETSRPTLRSREPSIRISRGSGLHRLSVGAATPLTRKPVPTSNAGISSEDWAAGRRRSSSEPQRRQQLVPDLTLTRPETGRSAHMAPVAEEMMSPNGTVTSRPILVPTTASPEPEETGVGGRLRKVRSRARSLLGMSGEGDDNEKPLPPVPADNEYTAHMVDILDVVDPEVSTLTTMTNVQNSLFIPNFGNILNRRPTYTVLRNRQSQSTLRSEAPTVATQATLPRRPLAEHSAGGAPKRPYKAQRNESLATINSTLSDSRYAVLPHGMSLDGWTKEDKEELNDHVRHLLHSKKEGFKRGWRGFLQYVSRPLGFFVTVYATLITLFGLAWVLFLIGWVNVGGKQLYVINVIDNVLVALFAIMGDGLAPFRAVDTYHMIFIAHYGHLTWKLRKKKNLPKLADKNDLPATQVPDVDLDLEAVPAGTDQEFTVLSPKQQAKLSHHQEKFAKSHTFYKPHETTTHYAFPLRLLITIVVLLDFHSFFQIALGACTWSINYKVRPFALTTVILCCSITCNITAGVLISIGDRRTRKKDVIEKMFRQELTEEAIHTLEKRRQEEAEGGFLEGSTEAFPNFEDTPSPSPSPTPARHPLSHTQHQVETPLPADDPQAQSSEAYEKARKARKAAKLKRLPKPVRRFF